MDEVIIDDLKQYIAVTTKHEGSLIRAELGKRIDKVEGRLDGVETKLDDLTSFVIDAIDISNTETDRVLNNHERRITKLERKAA